MGSPWKEKVHDPNEDNLDTPSRRRIFKQLKRLGRSWKPSKKSNDDSASFPLLPLADSEAPAVLGDPSRASPHASPMASDLPAIVKPAEAHRALEDGHGDNTLYAPSTGRLSTLGSHCPVSKVARPRTSWTSLWHPSRGDQLEITTVYPCRAENRDAVAADPSEPAKPPPWSETVPGNYATHAVLPPSPPHTPTDDDSDDGAPNKNPDVHSPEMAELRGWTEDEQASATATSTRPATSVANAREGTQPEQNEHRSAHDTAIEVERLRTEAERLRTEAERLRNEGERLRIEAQEKEAAASRAQLLVLDRQIELACIHVGSLAPASTDAREG
ncbi:hypothetical protein PAXINDRAFT_20867 [Paxillus involutus ATCC 200175]|uniref:Unplaced genomic scaffold PAXINscaffold_1314, whole genome shotgun sequence n=1 Tax=Paxillus involutus ATCC 200175 TaxID=664439 RepID=A0A0C9T335_PAXIN|nr:hypothetical protein PAXINDRAFT_20867 [Paxillus involutus ATCC 200175]